MAVSVIGIIVNVFNVSFLTRKREMIDFTKSFTNLLILLSIFDIVYLLNGVGIFGLPEVSTWYSENVYSMILPVW